MDRTMPSRWAPVRYAVVAALAFVLGSVSIAVGAPTLPLQLVRVVDRTDETRAAAVDASGNVAVRDVDTAALAPITLYSERYCSDIYPQCIGLFTLTGGAYGSTYRVPSGKRLVIDMVSGEIRVPPGQEITSVLIDPGAGVVGSIYLVPQPLGSNPDGSRTWLVSSLVRLYVEPEGIVGVSVRSANTSTVAGLRSELITIVGHLVNIP